MESNPLGTLQNRGQLCIRAKRGWKYLTLSNKQEFKQLSSSLSAIPLLKDKLTINQWHFFFLTESLHGKEITEELTEPKLVP